MVICVALLVAGFFSSLTPSSLATREQLELAMSLQIQSPCSKPGFNRTMPLV